MNVLVFKSSYRFNSNSSILADQVIQGAKDAGATVDCFDLTKMYILPCKACDSCREAGDGKCIQNDDMNGIYDKLKEADGIVLAGPIYWFSLPAQLKVFIDRWYALGSSQGHGLRGKRFGLVVTYGDSDPYSSGAINAFRMFQDSCSYLHAGFTGILYGSADKPGEVYQQPELMERAKKFGGKIARR